MDGFPPSLSPEDKAIVDALMSLGIRLRDYCRRLDVADEMKPHDKNRNFLTFCLRENDEVWIMHTKPHDDERKSFQEAVPPCPPMLALRDLADYVAGKERAARRLRANAFGHQAAE